MSEQRKETKHDWREIFPDVGEEPPKPGPKPSQVDHIGLAAWEERGRTYLVWTQAVRCHKLALVFYDMKEGKTNPRDMAEAMLILIIQSLETNYRQRNAAAMAQLAIPQGPAS